jgi:hypothetical protein
MHEIDRKTVAKVAEHFGLDATYTYRLLTYEVKSRVLI